MKDYFAIVGIIGFVLTIVVLITLSVNHVSNLDDADYYQALHPSQSQGLMCGDWNKQNITK